MIDRGGVAHRKFIRIFPATQEAMPGLDGGGVADKMGIFGRPPSESLEFWATVHLQLAVILNS